MVAFISRTAATAVVPFVPQNNKTINFTAAAVHISSLPITQSRTQEGEERKKICEIIKKVIFSLIESRVAEIQEDDMKKN